MLTEEQLVAWENQSVDPIGYGHVAHRAIPELIAEVRALRKIKDAASFLLDHINKDYSEWSEPLRYLLAEYEREPHA